MVTMASISPVSYTHLDVYKRQDMSDCKFGQDEDKMIYFFLLSSLRKEHFEAVGIEEKKPYSCLLYTSYHISYISWYNASLFL